MPIHPKARLAGAMPIVALAAGLVCAVPHGAVAEDYPARTVTLVVPYPAGGGVDTVGRSLARSE